MIHPNEIFAKIRIHIENEHNTGIKKKKLCLSAL